jgi:hypothetical protein
MAENQFNDPPPEVIFALSDFRESHPSRLLEAAHSST